MVTARGDDLGAKRAGTTVGCVFDGAATLFERCARGGDADRFVLGLIERYAPQVVGIDAPLSFPAVYSERERRGEGDYFYRVADRQLGAMSPLFLGGLSARAIRLRDIAHAQGVTVIEVYPAAVLREIGQAMTGLSKGECGRDRVKLDRAAETIARWGDLPAPPQSESWHDVDSLAALTTVARYVAGRAKSFGEAREGLIYV